MIRKKDNRVSRGWKRENGDYKSRFLLMEFKKCELQKFRLIRDYEKLDLLGTEISSEFH